MTNEHTVSTEQTVEADKDFAPLSPAQEISKTADDLSSIAPTVQTKNLIHLEKARRQKTSGEKLFDVVTYAGVALVGNELASNEVMKIVAPAKDDLPAGRLRGAYEKFESNFEKLGESRFLRGVKLPEYLVGNGLKGAERVAPRLPFLLTATVGGMFMVPPVKWLEDNKGAVVRKLDNWFHGKKTAHSPEMAAAHEEMDNAPRQTWASLGKGRVITVIAAAIADATFGWSKSLTANLLKGTRAEKYSSLDGIAHETANGIMKLSKMPKTIIENGEKVESKSFKKWHATTENLTWLLTLSTTLTALFYVTSKLMAKKEQTSKERKSQQPEYEHVTTQYADNKTLDIARDTQLDQALEADKPTSQVSNITHHRAIEQAQTAAQLS